MHQRLKLFLTYALIISIRVRVWDLVIGPCKIMFLPTSLEGVLFLFFLPLPTFVYQQQLRAQLMRELTDLK